jgi:hypothetical protein
VPYLGKYSKVGHDQGKANDGTAANDDGLKHHFAAKVVLTLSLDELKIQNTLPCEVPPRLAVHTMEPVPQSNDFFLFARRSGDQKEFAFRAVAKGPLYYIHVYNETVGTKKLRLMYEKPEPLEVMTSSEVGAGNRPMTGDYDLMAVCPRWGDYGGTTLKQFSKGGLDFTGKGLQKRAHLRSRFQHGQGARHALQHGRETVGRRLEQDVSGSSPSVTVANSTSMATWAT